MIQFSKPKIIIDPLLGLIDVTEIIPLMDTAPFQSLGFKYQLGLTSHVFPAATHTRKQHSLGAYARTKRLAEEWFNYGFINKEEARNLPIFALYHDIGHGPFSHVTESLGSINHDERGLEIIKGLKDVIESAGFNYELIHDIFSQKNPLYLAVFDKNLGMEKLDYLERDAFYTIGERPGVEYLAHHVYFINNQLVINEVALDQAKDIQDFYIKMYKHVYSRKKSAILQRLIEKMTYYLVLDGLTEEELFGFTDFGLLGRFEVSKNEKIRFYYDNFKKGIFPKLALEFKYKNAVTGSTQRDKLTKIVGLSEDKLDKINWFFSPKWGDISFVENLEKQIASLVGIPADCLIVVQPQSRKRIEPDDISVYASDGSIKKISQIYPEHFRAMKEYGRSHLSLRIAVFSKYRQKLYDQAEKVKDFIFNLNI